MSALVKSTII